MRRIALLFLVTLVGVGGCSAKKDAAPGAKTAAPDAAPAVAPLVAQYRTQIAANRARTCLRPPLWGDATVGPARDELLALVEPKGDVATCVELTKNLEDFKAALDVTQPVGAPDTMNAVTERIEKHCAMFPELAARATAHEDACSPFVVGGKAMAADSTMVRMGRVLPVLARARAREGKTAEALRILLDGVRLGDDLRRGPVDLSVVMIATVVSRMPLNVAEAILNSAPALPAADLDVLASAADTLLATVPRFGEAIAGERTGFGTIMMMKDGQEVPLGARELSAWQSHDDAMALIERACPVDASLAACRDGLAKTMGMVTEGQKVTLPQMERYIAKQAESLAHRAALRIDLELRRQGCDAAKMDASLLMPAALGEQMSIRAKPKTKGTWEIHYLWSGTDAVVWETRCGK